jgi:hypothetical protein
MQYFLALLIRFNVGVGGFEPVPTLWLLVQEPGFQPM